MNDVVMRIRGSINIYVQRMDQKWPQLEGPPSADQEERVQSQLSQVTGTGKLRQEGRKAAYFAMWAIVSM